MRRLLRRHRVAFGCIILRRLLRRHWIAFGCIILRRLLRRLCRTFRLRRLMSLCGSVATHWPALCIYTEQVLGNFIIMWPLLSLFGLCRLIPVWLCVFVSWLCVFGKALLGLCRRLTLSGLYRLLCRLLTLSRLILPWGRRLNVAVTVRRILTRHKADHHITELFLFLSLLCSLLALLALSLRLSLLLLIFAGFYQSIGHFILGVLKSV